MFLLGLDIRTLSFITVLFALGLGAGLLSFGMVYDAFAGLRRVGGGLLLIGFAFLAIILLMISTPFGLVWMANEILLQNLTGAAPACRY
ncbi:hypothetical protein [Pseudodesulfovibrio sp.]|uniref:hypothetical protein n=1 Tax=unclassified Pseudodesulfovibrio TaxID=2661612 RepID=UPI003B002B73